MKRVDTNAWFHTFPGNNSGTTVKTEYYIRSSVLGGQTISELDENGAKKVTHIYTGKGRLAEQRIINGTAGVYWRHEDIVTGSYAKIDINGQFGGHAEDSPTAVEYDPLGGMIETEAPPDESVNPANLMQFKFAGDNARPENGCLWNGDPMPCTGIPGLVRDSAKATINVNVRAEGGYSLYRTLSGLVSTWHYTIRERVNNEDSRLTPSHYQDSTNWHGNKYHLFVGSFFAQYLSDISETVISDGRKDGFGVPLRNVLSTATAVASGRRKFKDIKCWTLEDAIKFVAPNLKAAWDKSISSGKENGGILIITKNGELEVADEREGVKDSMPNTLQYLRDRRKDASTYGVVLTFHTHPSGVGEPSGIPNRAATGDYGVMNNSDGPGFGIIKYGDKDSEFIVYNKGRVIKKNEWSKTSIGCWDKYEVGE